MRAPVCFRLLVAMLALGCVLPGRAVAPDTLETEGHPVEPGLILRDRAQRRMLELQESNRLRVAIPHAVRSEVQLAPSAETLEAPLPPARPSIFEGREDYVHLTVIFMLLAGLAGCIWARHRDEAEIRRLCGGYLSDGTEVASFVMPEWFSPPPVAAPASAFAVEVINISSAEVTMPAPLTQFFAQAPERLAALGESLRELAGSPPLEGRQKSLQRALELIVAIKEAANCWDLRPAWQMSSAMELLAKRAADKPKDFTPSIARTLAAAADTLREVCVPGIRPNLLMDPPPKILAVDDDPLCRRALQFALEKASLVPDLAESGEKAVKLAEAHAYDAVFMDIQMPGIDGLTACTQIHETKWNPDVPVIFVTVQSDFNTRAQSRLKGGVDFMAKPFLVFELTVRAVTLAMRKRLLASSTNRQERPVAVAAQSKPVNPASMPAKVQAPAEPLSAIGDELNGDFFSQAPAFFATTRRVFEELRASVDLPAMQKHLGTLQLRLQALVTKAGLNHLLVASHLCSSLEALLKRLHRNPSLVTASTLNTASNALSLLESLGVPGLQAKLANHSPVRILVVDDDPLARRAVTGALQLAFSQPDSAQDGLEASALLEKTAYDVVFTDIQMPGLDGFGLCSAIRASTLNANTAVVFVSNSTDEKAQANANASGGNDFITKPFLPIEITVKALTYAWEGRLRKTLAVPASLSASKDNSAPMAAQYNRRDLAPAMLILQPPDMIAPEAKSGARATPEPAIAETRTQVVPINTGELNGDFLSEIPRFLAETSEIVEELQSFGEKTNRQAQLGALYLRVHTIAKQAGQAGLPIVSQVASTLEALLKRLHRNSSTVTSSTLNTTRNALKLLESLCVPGMEMKLAQHPAVRILVAEDEPLARRAVVGALQLAFEKPDDADNGTNAATLVAKTHYDVIFTDIQMPGLDGFQVCAAIRTSSLNADTPVVFITNTTDMEAQTKARACAGNDFIGKPFLPIEITVKALTLAWEGRVRRTLIATPAASSLDLDPLHEHETEPAKALLAA